MRHPDHASDLIAAPLGELLERARAVRGHRPITYSPKVFIPLTKLCRDVCGYCTFARPPRRGERAFLTDEEVLAIARAGAAAGCHEALFTLGDKPELRYRVARDELASRGCDTTLELLARMARLVLDETGLLPHLNPGALTAADVRALRPVSVSMGIMLETASSRLGERGMPHFGSPDKDPTVRLATIAAAGEAAVPFTSGILIGIGETRAERIDALLELRALGERHSHVQEVIIQNFRAKPGTRMASHPEPELDELLWTIASARIVLGPDWNLQCPPNLSDAQFGRLLDAGINDWGGVSPVTPDHVNPERPWPAIEALRAATEARDLALTPRLALYPEFVGDLERWVDPALASAVLERSDGSGLARDDRWAAGGDHAAPALTPRARRSPSRQGPVGTALVKAQAGEPLDEPDLVALFEARGPETDAVVAAADDLRRRVNGDAVTYVVTRNVNYTNVCYFHCGFCAFSKGGFAASSREPAYLLPVDEIVRRCEEAWERGAVEVCLQGGIHPGFTGATYLEICEAVAAAVPGLHIHAFSALEVWQGAATLGLGLDEYLERLAAAGLRSLPGTAAEILDDSVRRVICPDKLSTEQWCEVHEAAHRAGLRSTATVMFGHVDGPASWARHLLVVRDLQARTGGITEFVPLPFVHMEAPLYLKGRARPGPTFREAILMHAVARLGLHPWIRNVQASWVKLGVGGALAALRAGCNDLGGTLMNESISRAAGAAHGQELPPERMEAAIRSIGREPRQRTTFYAEPDPRRVSRSFGAAPLAPAAAPPARMARLRRSGHPLRPGHPPRPQSAPVPARAQPQEEEA
jgi:FO synthase